MRAEPGSRAAGAAAPRRDGAEGGASRWTRFLTGDWLTARRIYWLGFAGTVATILAIMALYFAEIVLARTGDAKAADFTVLWTTSVLTLEGRPALAYDLETNMALQAAALGRDDLKDLPWIYPPTFQIIVAPLGLLPLGYAKLCWMLATAAFYLAVVWRILPGRATIFAAIATPVVLNLFHMGQTGFVTAGLAGIGLLCWHRRPVLAGIAFGLMSIKPQLALAGPIAAIAGGRWRILLAAIGAGLAFAALSLALFGAETWGAFPSALERAGTAFRDLPVYHFYASLYGGLRWVGFGFAPAMAAQAALSFAVGVAVVRGFRGPVTAPDRQAALLAYAMIAISPRVMDYDLLILFLGALFQVRHARACGAFPGERLVLLAAMLVCYADLLIPVAIPEHFTPTNVLVAPLLLAGLLLGERYRPGRAAERARAAPAAGLARAAGVQAGRFLRFGVVGVAATLTHVGVLTALVELAGIDPRLANLAGFALAVPVSYLGHYHWSFGSEHPHGETLARFVVVAASSLAGSQALMHLALDGLGAGYGVGIALMVVVMPLVNFAVQQALVFRRRPRASGGDGRRA